jgi:mRNA interferase RelE/StbE
MKWSVILAWLIKIDDEAQKDLAKLDKQIAKRITAFLRERVAVLDDPRSIGEALKGSRLGDFWKYRVGDYRIISNIEDGALRILVVKIGNRREVYRNHSGKSVIPWKQQ